MFYELPDIVIPATFSVIPATFSVSVIPAKAGIQGFVFIIVSGFNVFKGLKKKNLGFPLSRE